MRVAFNHYMSKTGEREEPWEIQHEVVCVPGQQWQHIDI